MSTLEAGLEGLHIVDRGAVRVVVLERPPANALSRQLIANLGDLFRGLGAQADAPAVVLTGHGDRFFCAGGDIKELDGAGERELAGRMHDFHSMLVAMDRYPAPIVAAVNGVCVGGGMEIALFADHLLAAPHARFGFPEINHGLLPAAKGVQRSVAVLGLRATRRMLLSGELFGADRALEIGLVDEFVDLADLVDLAVEHAAAAARKAPVLYAALRRNLRGLGEEQDALLLEATLHAASDYFDDPVARSLREGWGNRRPASERGPDHREGPC